MNAILKMRRGCLFAVLAALVAMAAPAMAQLAVTNVRSCQRAGTKLVDIYYDLNSGPSWVSLSASSDAGATYAVPTSSVSGHVGAGVAPGTNRKITWNAGTDWNGQYSTAVKFRVTASDTAPVPTSFALIPAGSFQMGNALPLTNEYSDELPVHTVNVSAFFMDKHEVTKALWDEVRAWGLNNGYTDLPTGKGKAVNHPVYSITWYSMVKWCNARSQKEGLLPCYTVSGAVYKTTDNSAVACNMNASGYRLPTEAEWEKAARGGLSGKRFPWGDTISRSQANYYGDTSNTVSYDFGPGGLNPTYNTGGSPYTAPVGSFAANGYGLYDMAGNVQEWCWDWTGAYGSGAVSDPTGPASGSLRVLRGGSGNIGAGDCRVSRRDSYYPAISNVIGFRCARR